MKKNVPLDKRVLHELSKPKDLKERCSFTVASSVKSAFSDWCAENNVKESNAIEEMIKQLVPSKFFKGVS